MLLEGDFGKLDSEKRQVIEDLYDNNERLIRMVNLFLNISRIESGRFKIDRVKVQIEDLIEGVLKELTARIKRKKLQVEFLKPDKKLPALFIDADKIKDVVLNLIDNALKYTEKGKITIRAEVHNSDFLCSVQDTGVGIDPKEVPKLFSKFVRASGIAKVQPSGSGLGLFVAKKMVEAHGGKIWVESKGLGRGSTFKFSLPLKTNKA